MLALAIMTADCVPVMISSQDGEVIGAIHGLARLGQRCDCQYRTEMAHQIESITDNQDFNAAELAQITNGGKYGLARPLAKIV